MSHQSQAKNTDKKVSITINGKLYVCDAHMSVLQVCRQHNIDIPAFCDHEKLKVSGSCRMCIVEVKGLDRPVISCAAIVEDGMDIFTDSSLVQEYQKGNLEYLLINHPLECPVCDKAGECSLQDAAVVYGSGRAPVQEAKRAVARGQLNPFIETAMHRCIYCTKCIRFIQEIAGVPELDMLGRGANMEVGIALKQVMRSELSGNIIDLCPVGALLSKPYAAKGRPWEENKIASIDVMDAVGSNIYIHVRNNEIMRILPRTNDAINENWIADKARFSYDGLCIQRLDVPYVRKNGKLERSTWVDALKTIVKKITSVSPTEIGIISGRLTDVETLFLMRQLADSMDIPHRDCFQETVFLPTAERGDYLFNTTIEGIEKADACLIIGTNPRREAPLVNARLRKRHLKGDFPIGLVGPSMELTYPYEHLSDAMTVLNEIAAGKHPFCKVLGKAANPMLMLGMGALRSVEGEAVYKTSRFIAQEFNFVHKDWNGFNILHTDTAPLGGVEVGFLPAVDGYNSATMIKAAQSGKLKVLYLLGADEIPMQSLGNVFVIYQGHHGDAGAHRADVVLPGAAYTEKSAFYVNTEGRVQETTAAIQPLGEAKEDWKIIRGLSEVLGHKLPYNTREQIVEDLKKCYKTFTVKNKVVPARTSQKHQPQAIKIGGIKLTVDNFYATNSICRASALMAQAWGEE